MTPEQHTRFWSKVRKEGPIPSHKPELGNCWEWLACKRVGYGCVKINGRAMGAHRVAFEEENGPIPDEIMVCHHCDNPACVRPSHLFAGDRSSNQLDAISKGRAIVPKGKAFQRGCVPPNRSLNDEEATALVMDILANKGKRNLKTLAVAHGVSYEVVRDISSGRSYIRVAEALTRTARMSDPGSLPGGSTAKALNMGPN